jgi:hypothetical protein
MGQKIEIPRTIMGATLDQLIRIGFNVVPDMRGASDGVYTVAEIPQGWEIRPGARGTNAQYLHDQAGRLRGVLFHKIDYAARFRDMRSLTMLARFSIDPAAFHRASGYRQVVVKDASGEVVHHAGRYLRTDLAGQGACVQRARAWLGEKFPRWEDPMAHWDDVAPAVKPVAHEHVSA